MPDHLHDPPVCGFGEHNPHDDSCLVPGLGAEILCGFIDPAITLPPGKVLCRHRAAVAPGPPAVAPPPVAPTGSSSSSSSSFEFVVEFVQFVQFVEFLFICLEFVVEFIEILIQFLVIEQFFIFQRRRLHPGKDPQGVDSACNGLLDDGHDKPCSRLGMGPARQHLHLVGQLRFLRGLAGRCLSSTLCGAEHSVLAYLRASLCLAQGGHSLAQGETVEEWPCL